MANRTDHPWRSHYNGFSWRERCAVIPVQNAAVREGRLIRPIICCICLDGRCEHPQGRDYRFLHLEDYRKPLKVYGCCKRCHATVHARFRDPRRWEELMRLHRRSGEWFTLLSIDPASQWQPFEITYPCGLPWTRPKEFAPLDLLNEVHKCVEQCSKDR